MMIADAGVSPEQSTARASHSATSHDTHCDVTRTSGTEHGVFFIILSSVLFCAAEV